jgi:hypothetical protein
MDDPFSFSGFGKKKGGGLSVMDWVMRIGGVIVVAVIIYFIITNWSKITNFTCGSKGSSVPSAPPAVEAAAGGGAQFGRMLRQFGKARRSGF